MSLIAVLAQFHGSAYCKKRISAYGKQGILRLHRAFLIVRVLTTLTKHPLLTQVVQIFCAFFTTVNKECQPEVRI